MVAKLGQTALFWAWGDKCKFKGLKERKVLEGRKDFKNNYILKTIPKTETKLVNELISIFFAPH